MMEILKKRIDHALTEFLDKIKKDYRIHRVNPPLYHHLREFTLRPGKRIRPLLLLWAYQGYAPASKIPSSLYNAAISIELLHDFMLIHDDIIDQSDLRRGKPTLHKLLQKEVKNASGEKIGWDLGIVAGDVLYAFAIEALLEVKSHPARKEKALRYFVQTAAFTAMGEFIDTLHGLEQLEKVNETDVFLNYSLKTARYTFSCPLVIGAILAGAPDKEIKQLTEFGRLIGQAFQIQDDIIGTFDSEKNIGKSILSDLAESKKTLLTVHAYHRLKGPQQRLFRQIFNKKDVTMKDLKKIRELLIRAGSFSHSMNEIQTRIKKSRQIFSRLKMKPRVKNTINASLQKLFQHTERLAQKYLKHHGPSTK